MLSTRWTLAVGLGIAVGFCIAAAFTLLVAAQITGEATWAAAAPIWGASILGGLVQGVIVGVLQVVVLRSWVPDLRGVPWVAVTAVVAAIGWAVGMAIVLALLINSQDIPITAADLEEAHQLNWQVAFIGIASGAALGALFGLAQGALLRRRVPHALLWVPANALAWAAGVALLAIGLSTPEEGWPLPATITAAVFTFVLTGLVVGLVTGRFLRYLKDIAP